MLSLLTKRLKIHLDPVCLSRKPTVSTFRLHFIILFHFPFYASSPSFILSFPSFYACILSGRTQAIEAVGGRQTNSGRCSSWSASCSSHHFQRGSLFFSFFYLIISSLLFLAF